MERDPDIAALASRLGLRQLKYRTFERPAMPEPVARAAEPPTEAPPAAPEAPAPAQLAPEPEPLVAVRPAQPFIPPPIVAAPQPTAAVAPMQFPLLQQALSRQPAAAQAAMAPAAQPFLNLRHVIAETSRQAEH
jgi:hypothetical protein